MCDIFFFLFFTIYLSIFIFSYICTHTSSININEILMYFPVVSNPNAFSGTKVFWISGPVNTPAENFQICHFGCKIFR